jgi:hypothetical protein
MGDNRRKQMIITINPRLSAIFSYCYPFLCDRRCNMEGSDLLQVYTSGEESLVLSVLGSRTDFAQPVMPGEYPTKSYKYWF